MCAMPGNPACGTSAPQAHFEPALQAAVWLGALGLLLFFNWGERRRKRLLYLGAWLFCALATMAKGPAGLVLPAACALAYVCAMQSFRGIVLMEVGSGLLMVAVIVLPWFVAMLVRHGGPFTDELIFNDMVNRAFGHVHDTNDGADTSFRYYALELGYGLFPWVGLAPLGLAEVVRYRTDGRSASLLMLLWFVATFALFSMMGTKFHHYIFPAVPPLAVLSGIALDRLLSEDNRKSARGAAAVAGAFVVLLVLRDLAEKGGAAHFEQLFTYRYDRAWPASLDFRVPIAIFGGLFALLLALMAFSRLRRWAVYGFVTAALAWAVWGLDVYMPRTSPHWGQRAVIEAYYRNRVGPEEPLLAYQLNWKGENFYTGNLVAQFISSGATFTNWVKEQREKGTQVVYAVTEHGRINGLRSESGAKGLREMTTREDANQFVLVRLEL